MNTLAIIPSRYASTRFPGKPLTDILGQTMIQRVYRQCIQAFNHVCVATDDERIFSHVKSFSGEVVMTSPTHRSGTDRCLEAYEKYSQEHPEISFDLIINVQGDEPFIHPQQLRTLESAFQDRNIDLASMSKKIDDATELFDPNTPKVITDREGFAIYFSRETLPHLRNIDRSEWIHHHDYYKHVGLYAYRPETLKLICSLETSNLEKAESLEQLRWIENGLKIKIIETTFQNLSVDTPEDLKKIQKKFQIKQ